MCGFRQMTATELEFLREKLRVAMDNTSELLDGHSYASQNYSASERNARLLLNLEEAKRILGKLQSAARREMFHFTKESY